MDILQRLATWQAADTPERELLEACEDEIERLRASVREFLDMFEARPDLLARVGVAEGLVIARATELIFPKQTT